MLKLETIFGISASSSGPLPDRRRAGTATTAFLTLLIVWWFLPLLPPPPFAHLDSSWMLGLGLAWELGFKVGTDVVFTYGPLGALVTGQYWRATYLPALFFWAIIAGTAGWLAIASARGVAERTRHLVAFMLLALTPDSAVLALPLAFVLHGWKTRRMTAAAWIGCFTLGLLAMTKFTCVPQCAAALACGLAMRRPDLRTAAAAGVLAVLGVAAAFAWAGQPLGSLPAYLLNASEVTRHYPDAMQWPVFYYYRQLIIEQLLSMTTLAISAAAACGAIAVAAWRRPRAELPRISLAAYGLAITAIVFRHGTTRGDYIHFTPAILSLAAVILAWYPAAGTPRRWIFALALALAAGLIATTPAAKRLLVGRCLDTLRGTRLVLAASDPRTTLDAAVARHADGVRRDFGDAYPKSGSIDVISFEQHLLLGGDPRRWRPRPVIQSYSAYSRRLASMNAARLRAVDGPEWLIVAPQTIDNRLPTMDDAAAWEVLRTHYRLARRHERSHLVLERRPRPDTPPAWFTEARTVSATDWVDVPATRSDDGLYVSIECPRGIGNRLVALVWKPPLRLLDVRLSSGKTMRYRLPSAIAKAGFLIQPLIVDTDGLADWLEGNAPAGESATAIRVVDFRGRPVPSRITFGGYPYDRD